MIYLWDTNACIYFIDNKLSETANQKLINYLENNNPVISFISEIELLVWDTENQSDIDQLNQFVVYSDVIAFDQRIKEETIYIRKTFRIKLPDAIIAATAIVNDFFLLTRNIKDFTKINGLKVADPFQL